MNDEQRTLSIIKPDAILSKCQGKIIDFLEKKGFKIIAQKKIDDIQSLNGINLNTVN